MRKVTLGIVVIFGMFPSYGSPGGSILIKYNHVVRKPRHALPPSSLISS
jgi:hypothetical protein